MVGVNSDASVRRLKGPDRPVQDEGARAAVLAALGVVDLVVIFGEDTPEDLIRALKPDLLFKGADYAGKEIPGGAFVKATAGRSSSCRYSRDTARRGPWPRCAPVMHSELLDDEEAYGTRRSQRSRNARAIYSRIGSTR